jgi:hypothetical protein
MTEITVVLVGGPAHLPNAERLRRVPPEVDTIKLGFGAGYEHFHYRGDMTRIGDEEMPTFRWIGRTAIAE